MGRPYSMDLRQRAMDRLASGESCHDVAVALKVVPSSVIKWAQRHRRTGSAAPGKMGGHRPHVNGGAKAGQCGGVKPSVGFPGRTLVEIASLEGKSIIEIELCLGRALISLGVRSMKKALEKAAGLGF